LGEPTEAVHTLNLAKRVSSNNWNRPGVLLSPFQRRRQLQVENIALAAALTLPHLHSAWGIALLIQPNINQLPQLLREKLLLLFYLVIQTFSYADDNKNKLVGECFDETYFSWMHLFMSVLQTSPSSFLSIKFYIVKVSASFPCLSKEDPDCDISRLHILFKEFREGLVDPYLDLLQQVSAYLHLKCSIQWTNRELWRVSR